MHWHHHRHVSNVSLFLVLILVSAFLFSSSVLSLSTHAPRSNLHVGVGAGGDADSVKSALTRYSERVSPPPIPDGILLVSTLDGALHALDAQTGNHRWGGKYGTGEALVRSTPVSPILTQSTLQPGDHTLFDPFSVVDEDYDSPSAASSPSADANDHLIIPGVDGQLFFTTRQGSLERLPVTITELVSASPFRSVDDRMYVGKKSSTLFLLDRRNGEVHRVFSATSMEDVRQENCSASTPNSTLEENLLWIGKQDLSVHALDGKNGRRWNVSLGEYFSFVDGEEKQLDETQLTALGLPHLAATVDGEIYAIKDITERDGYLWRYAFHSPISAVHFVRNPTNSSSCSSSSCPSALSSSSMIKLPVYYLPPPDPRQSDNHLSELSLVRQYLYVRMKQAKTKSVDTYIGKTADGMMYALPNPISADEIDAALFPVEIDFLPGPFLPPAEEENPRSVIPVVGSNQHYHCPPTHPLYPHCIIGLHSIPLKSAYHTDIQLPGLPLPVNTSAAPVISRTTPVIQQAEYMYHTADDNLSMQNNGGQKDMMWSIIMTSTAVSLCISIPLVLGLYYTQMKNNAKKKKKKKAPIIDTSIIHTPLTHLRLPPADSNTSIAGTTKAADEDEQKDFHSPSGEKPQFLSNRAGREDGEEKLQTSPRVSITLADGSSNKPLKSPAISPDSPIIPSTSSPHLLVPSPSPRSDSSETQHSQSPPTNSDGSLAIPSASITSVIASLSKAYTIGKIQIFADQVLGTGSMGTVVYAGLHETRECAVKRLVKPFFGHENADKEISLLIQSDQHNNVLRYYAKEEDASFIYIALEKCTGSLQDLVEKPTLYKDANKLQILHNMMTGLAHLHSLNIVHRDIKPANVLLTKHHACKLADMGLGKQLGLSRSSFDSLVSGSFGWQPPEVLTTTGSRLTKAVDVFSAGCVIYYVLSDGSHPYGVNVEREMNIVRNHINYCHLTTDRVEAIDLISSMLSFHADDRLSAADCVSHPLFWSDEQKLHFLQDASDRVEAEPEYSECRLTLEYDAERIVGKHGWDGVLHQGLLDNLGKFRKYDFHSVRDLLRVIRNKRHHYRDLPLEVQHELGPVPTGFLHYFTSRFPDLLMHAYAVMACFCVEGDEDAGKHVIYSTCPLDRIEADQELGISHPSLSAPLHAWISTFSLTAQFHRYYEQMSMKRLLQLQSRVRLKYRPWYNPSDQWAASTLNKLQSDRVVLVKGFGELVMNNAEECERNTAHLRREQQQELQQQQQQQQQQQNNNSNRSSSQFSPIGVHQSHGRDKDRSNPLSPPYSTSPNMFPPLTKHSSANLTSKSNNHMGTTANAPAALPSGFTYVQNKQRKEIEVQEYWDEDDEEQDESNIRPQQGPQTPTLTATVSQPTGKSYSAALAQPSATNTSGITVSAMSSITTVSPSSNAQPNNPQLYQHLLRLPKKPISQLTPKPK